MDNETIDIQGQNVIGKEKSIEPEKQPDELKEEQPTEPEAPKRPKRKYKKQVRVPKTQKITLSLFEQGLTPEQIAAQRDLAPGTIIGHLADLITLGKLNIYNILGPSIIQQIEEVINAADSYKLLLLKELCPEEITFDEIRLVIGHHKYLLKMAQAEEESNTTKGDRT